MNFRKVINAIKRVDEDLILRQYTKLTRAWESKGRDRHTLAGISSAIGFGALLSTLYNFNALDNWAGGWGGPNPEPGTVARQISQEDRGFGYQELSATRVAGSVAARAFDVVSNFVGYMNRRQNQNLGDTGAMVEKPYWEKALNITRLPAFGTGVYFLVRGGIQLVSSLAGDATIPDALNYLVYSLAPLGLASSIYIRNADEQILKRKPFWKSAYEVAADKVKELTRPLPTPSPLPVLQFDYES